MKNAAMRMIYPGFRPQKYVISAQNKLLVIEINRILLILFDKFDVFFVFILVFFRRFLK